MPATSFDPKTETQEDIDRRRGRFVPWIIAAFYVTFMSALIGFVVIAYRDPPNEVTPEAYEKGLAYNATLDAAARQSRLGWTSAIDFSGHVLTFRISDRKGLPITDADVKAWFVHPSKAALDQSVTLTPAGPGLYRATVNLPSSDNWAVHVTAARDGAEYQAVADIEAP